MVVAAGRLLWGMKGVGGGSCCKWTNLVIDGERVGGDRQVSMYIEYIHCYYAPKDSST